MGTRMSLITLLLTLSFLPLGAQDWERIKSDPGVVWGEGWGTSVAEADREALASLSSRISVGVTGDFRSLEEQRTGPSGTAYSSVRSSRLRTVTSTTLSNTGRVVLKGGRKSHVGRWIRRSELEGLFADRERRLLDYEASALQAEREARPGDALRYHYWAYILLRSLQRPSELRDGDGRMLLNTIPERMNGILRDLTVTAEKDRDRLILSFRFRGRPAESLTFSCFGGAGWSLPTEVRGGRAEVGLAPGAPAEIVQLRIEYEYASDAAIDGELSDLLSVADTRPLKKANIIFRR